MSENIADSATPARPTTDDADGWKAYWQAQNMPWRTEPEITTGRQAYLTERRAIPADIERGIYPFKGIEPKLTRADIEWLLATHESGGMRGPVNWDDGSQRQREGLDLRGAELPNIDLSGLPLARLHAGLDGGAEYDSTTAAGPQREWAALHIPGANLNYVRLEGARLSHAHMEGVSAQMVRLEGAELYAVHLEGAPPADLRFSTFDARTRLDYVTMGNKNGVGPRLRGVQWGGVDHSFVDWSRVRMLDDERRARRWREYSHDTHDTRLRQYRRAVQVNSVLASVLHAQGANQQADYFAYRAKVCQRAVLWRQGPRSWGVALGSWLLDLISGYGYRPIRSFITYALVVLGFAVAYFALGDSNGAPIPWNEALVVSMTAFHGRGFFSSVFQPGDLQAAVAAIEAFIGLLIEIVLIATFTQRYFGAR